MRAISRPLVCALLAVPAVALAQSDPKFKYGEQTEVQKAVWKAQIGAGLNLTGGNSTLYNVTGNVLVSRNDGVNKLQLDADGAYAKAVTLADNNANGRIDPGEETSKESVKRWQASIRYDRFFSLNNKGYILGITGANEIAGKELYFGGQLGYSRQLYKSDMHELLLEAGVDFSREQYVTPVGGAPLDALNILSVRAFFGDQMKFSKDTGLVIGVEYLGNVLTEKNAVIDGPSGTYAMDKGVLRHDASYFEDSRVNAKAALTTKLTSWMSFSTSFTIKYDNVPALRPGYGIASEKIDTLADASLIVTLL